MQRCQSSTHSSQGIFGVTTHVRFMQTCRLTLAFTEFLAADLLQQNWFVGQNILLQTLTHVCLSLTAMKSRKVVLSVVTATTLEISRIIMETDSPVVSSGYYQLRSDVNLSFYLCQLTLQLAMTCHLFPLYVHLLCYNRSFFFFFGVS